MAEKLTWFPIFATLPDKLQRVTYILQLALQFSGHLLCCKFQEKLPHVTSPLMTILVSILTLMFLLQLFAWGYNGNGQLGVGNNVNQLTPCKVIGLVGTITTQVKALFPSSC